MSKIDRATVSATMTVEEFTQYVRISRTSAYRLFRAGDLKPIKIRNRTLVRRIDADDFLARCAQASAA
ncbi:helix-turn-helix domain-containing protein [Methylorubrum thiocyanatum]|uniref:helix-turn-helix domain-containing protein n=1 Tax=Methylorubrum thiocyanatum TaxID=47958 RepID=UPI0036608E10